MYIYTLLYSRYNVFSCTLSCSYSLHTTGAGAKDLAEAVIKVCEQPTNFKFLYPLDLPIEEKIELIAREIYRADGIEFSQYAKEQIERYKKQGTFVLFVCLFVLCFVCLLCVYLFIVCIVSDSNVFIVSFVCIVSSSKF